jgi:hypothetical protein
VVIGKVIVIVVAIVWITIWSTTILFFLGVHVTRMARVPGLHVRCWRRRVVRIWGICAWTFVPRVAVGLVLTPMFASIIRSRSGGVALETIIRRRFGGMTRWIFKGLCGWTSWKACGEVLRLLLGWLSG